MTQGARGPHPRILIIRGIYDFKEGEPCFEVFLRQSDGRTRFVTRAHAIELDTNTRRGIQ